MDVRQAVADNLRAIREERKLSLDAAAQLSGVSKSMLGQIERGEVNPTISVLWKIAAGLKVSFTALIELPREDVMLVRQKDIKPFVEDEGRYHNYPVFAFDAERGYEQYRIILEPGGSLGAKPHMAGTEESIIVFSGILLMTVDGQTYRLEKGDGLRFRADVPHGYAAGGDEAAEISMVIRYKDQ